MEAVVEKLQNTLSHARQSIPITITGRITNDDGTFVEQLEEPIKLDESANYHVYLNDFTSWSNIPNVTESNRNFYYTVPGKTGEQKITFPISTHSVDTYNDFLYSCFRKFKHLIEDPASTIEEKKWISPVKFTSDLSVMRVVMHVYVGCSVTFKDDTWFKELGFEKKTYEGMKKNRDGVVISEGIYMAPHMADIVRSLNILIRTNLSLDWRFKGKRTNILYNIINNVPAGMILSEKPNPVKRVELRNKNISEIILTFDTEDGLRLSFNGEEFVMTIVIERM